MKVKIVKAGSGNNWYSKHVGEIFEAARYSESSYVIAEDSDIPPLFIFKTDCVEIKNCIIIDGVEIKLSKEMVKEIKRKIEAKEELMWIPKIGEIYYTTPMGDETEYTWENDGTDKRNLELGLVFKTKEIVKRKMEDMKEEVNRKFVEIESYVRNNPDGWVADWSDVKQLKYHIAYNSQTRDWSVVPAYNLRENNTYMSQSMALKVLDLLRKQRE